MKKFFSLLLIFSFSSLFTFPIWKGFSGESPKSGLILLSKKQEQAIGNQAFQEIKKQNKLSSDPKLRGSVKRVIEAVAPQADADVPNWEFAIFENKSPNAFALPGGKIGINTGLFPITQNDNGLATVLGHEIAHVALRHGAQRMTQQTFIGLGGMALDLGLGGMAAGQRKTLLSVYGVGTTVGAALPYSRKHELEADRLGLTYMAKAGYDPREAIKFWKRMQNANHNSGNPPEFLSTHPADSRRIKEIEALLPEAMPFYKKKK